MKHSTSGSDVDAFVQKAPALSAQSLDHRVCRSDGERDHQKESQHAYGNERPLYDVTGGRPEIKEFVEPDISRQVKTPVKECIEAEHAAELYSAMGGRAVFLAA